LTTFFDRRGEPIVLILRDLVSFAFLFIAVVGDDLLDLGEVVVARFSEECFDLFVAGLDVDFLASVLLVNKIDVVPQFRGLSDPVDPGFLFEPPGLAPSRGWGPYRRRGRPTGVPRLFPRRNICVKLRGTFFQFRVEIVVYVSLISTSRDKFLDLLLASGIAFTCKSRSGSAFPTTLSYSFSPLTTPSPYFSSSRPRPSSCFSASSRILRESGSST